MTSFPKETETVLSATGLSRSFDDDPLIFEDIDLVLKEGEFASILGLSGSGKTTLFNLSLIHI